MNRTEKEAVVAELQESMGGAASVVFADLSGMDVETVNSLRSKLRAKGVQCRVAKNTLIRRAVDGTDMAVAGALLAGPTALIWHEEEPAIPAKVVKQFVKDAAKPGIVKVKGAYLDGELLDEKSAMTLADMPSKDELRAKLLGAMKLVPGKFLALLETPPRKFLGVLIAKKEKDEKEAA